MNTLLSSSPLPRRWSCPSRPGSIGLLLMIALVLSALRPAPVRAGGLYLMPRGTVPLARAGAAVAGSRSAHALWYNPAGLARSPNELLMDANLPVTSNRFTRYYDTTDENAEGRPVVDAPGLMVPIPTMAVTHDFGLEKLTFGGGLLIPMGSVPDWPDEVQFEGQTVRAPQRYSILDAEGSALGMWTVGVGYRATPRLNLGAAVYLMAGQIASRVAVVACDGVVCTIPESREFEGQTRVLLGPFLVPTGALGMTYDFDNARLGLSVNLPYRINGEATFKVSLPDTLLTRGARVEGDKADMSITFPAILRAGLEVDFRDDFRVEFAATYETWSMQDKAVVKPRDVWVRGLPSGIEFKAQDTELLRGSRDTIAVAMGAELDAPWLIGEDYLVIFRAGMMYETSAFTDEWLSPLTMDAEKIAISLGSTWHIGDHWKLDGVVGHMIMPDRVVRDSKVRMPVTLRPQLPDEDPETYAPGDNTSIANGDYQVSASYIGGGFRWLF